MTSPIGDPGSSARSAIEAALRRHADSVARVQNSESQAVSGSTRPGDFSSAFENGLNQVEATVNESHQLVDDFLTGKVQDFHEVAMRLKESELSFRFVMEVRNKFVDAYREVMRMSV